MSLRARVTVLSIVTLMLLAAFVPYDLSNSMIPFYKFWGLDFQNVWTFHHCELRNAPYSQPMSGAICHDAGGRPMNYPPLLYWSFFWTRFLDFPTARHVWVVAILLLSYVGITQFLPADSRAAPTVQIYVGLLFAQFPALFAIERGNNDAIVVLLWGLSFRAFRRSRFALSGVIAGVAAMAKIYPLFAVAVVAVALLLKDRRIAVRFISGAAAAGATVCLLFAGDTLAYISTLKQFAAERPGPSAISHSLLAFFNPPTALFLGLLLLVIWCGAGRVLLQHSQDDMLFAASLAIATFYPSTSYDYNLITAYPLLAVLFARARTARASLLPFASLWLLLFLLAGPRAPFRYAFTLHTLLQVLALIITAGVAIRLAKQGQDGDEDRRIGLGQAADDLSS